MTDKELKDHFDKIDKKLSEVKTSSDSKGHFFIILLLILILWAICDIHEKFFPSEKNKVVQTVQKK